MCRVCVAYVSRMCRVCHVQHIKEIHRTDTRHTRDTHTRHATTNKKHKNLDFGKKVKNLFFEVKNVKKNIVRIFTAFRQRLGNISTARIHKMDRRRGAWFQRYSYFKYVSFTYFFHLLKNRKNQYFSIFNKSCLESSTHAKSCYFLVQYHYGRLHNAKYHLSSTKVKSSTRWPKYALVP